MPIPIVVVRVQWDIRTSHRLHNFVQIYLPAMFSDNLTQRVRTFDAFPKVSTTYSRRSSQGGATTILLTVFCLYLIWSELGSYLTGLEDHQFKVEDHVGWDMQMNFDITVAMPCVTLHVNVQDVAGDRVLASELIEMEPTEFDLRNTHELTLESRADSELDDNLETVFRRAKVAKKFSKTKKFHHPLSEACRIYGSLNVNKVEGDFHITAKNYAYPDRESGSYFAQEALNFSHVIDEFSFGEFYPKLENPLDGVAALLDQHMFRYQYYLSIVPTTYVGYGGRKVVHTNQYAVTEQPTPRVNPTHPPGIFFKYTIEPLGMTITERRTPFIQFLVRLINVLGGVVVCTGWLYPLLDSAWEKWVTRGKSVPHDTQTMLDTGLKRED
ncbi:endoplasmic reticulum vesicle transporter-domain-containing protein [Lipomyces oligophaga]|uniref:endoplasmic reticulum vesicle transporter-domain-containing protein n=1 Tax=Lipomyces oligophaga TaxID=45792 RepID=UPI0034CEAC88